MAKLYGDWPEHIKVRFAYWPYKCEFCQERSPDREILGARYWGTVKGQPHYLCNPCAEDLEFAGHNLHELDLESLRAG